MKTNPTRYSSAVGEVWVMATFKIKYCHKIFDMGLYSKPQIAKKFRGYVAYNLFRLMPWLKANKWEGGYSGTPAYRILPMR